MATIHTLREAYLLGCKLAQAEIRNANNLEKIVKKTRKTDPSINYDKRKVHNVEDDVRDKHESGVSFGAKNPMAQVPEWTA